MVKKLFYNKEETKSSHKLKLGGEDSSVVPGSVQKILDQKKDQLDKAIKYYNQEQTKLNTQKLQAENQQKKFKIEQKEWENLKKKQKELFEK